MPNITIQLDENLYNRIRIYAAYRNTTVTQLVREFFQGTIPAGFSAERAELEVALRKFPVLSHFSAALMANMNAVSANDGKAKSQV